MDLGWSTEHLMNNYGQRNLAMVRGEGAYLYDASGRKYLDFMAGIAVCNLGHAHSEISKIIAEQAEMLLHCSNLFEIPQQAQLADKLAQLSGLDQVFFCNSGAEANEAAMKLARKYAATKNEPDRTEILSLPGAFHGRTLGALSITPRAAYQDGYHPLLPDCFTPDTVDALLSHMSHRTAACFVEVVQGEGGVRLIPDSVLEAIAQRCKEVGALLIIDEVQTGVGRTGTFFAYEQTNILPDVVTMAKGLANGVPIGAVIARAEVAAAFTAGAHGSTFGGNPLATSVANRVVDIVSEPSFLERVRVSGDHLARVLTEQLNAQDLSGRGLMWGMTVADSKAFVSQAADAGVLLTSVGQTRVRFVPPLIITEEHIEELVTRLQKVIA